MGKVESGAPVATTTHTVTSWMWEWLEGCQDNLAPRTVQAYEGYIRLHIVPTIGRHRLDRLRPEHVAAMQRTLARQGMSPASIQRYRSVLHRALVVAQRYGHVATNVVDLTDPPKQVEPERLYLTTDEARKVIAATDGDRLRARYVTALYLGQRQGELLGLRWQDVDLDTGTLAVRQQVQRLVWQHGCQATRPEKGTPAECGKVRGADCPTRHGGGLVARTPKSKAGRRTMPIPAPLLAELKAHRRRQAAERLHAGSEWHDMGLVFTTPFGKPLDPATDYAAWRALLTRSGVTVGGTHMARRTCATLLLEAGVDARIVADILGHSSVALTQNVYMQTDLRILKVGTDAIGDALGGRA